MIPYFAQRPLILDCQPRRRLSTDLNVFVREADVGEVLVDGALLVNEAARLATEPDLMFCT